MKETILSIITVNFNNNRGLINTLESVKQQSFTSYEHIIIDANSSDGSKETIIQYAKETTHLTYWISEPDNGIYYGMNKGIEQAHGEYLYFLNSGDCLKEEVLSQIQFDGTQYIYCDITVILPDNYKLHIQYPDHINTALLLIRDTFCHQACFIHHSLFTGYRYNTNYTIVSDWIHIIHSIVIKNCSYKHIPIDIADYDGGGFSATNPSVGPKERDKWLRENLLEIHYRTLMDTNKILTDLEQTRNCLSIYQNSELRDIIPLISHTRKFSKRMKKLIILLYKINNIFSKSKAK